MIVWIITKVLGNKMEQMEMSTAKIGAAKMHGVQVLVLMGPNVSLRL